MSAPIYMYITSIFRQVLLGYGFANQSQILCRASFGRGFWVESLLPSQQFSRHVGMEPPLPGYYQYFMGGQYILLNDTTRRPE